jgi:hypothetical protein
VAQETLMKELVRRQFEAPYRHEPRINRPDYGPFINPLAEPTRRSHDEIRLLRRSRHHMGGLMGPWFSD